VNTIIERVVILPKVDNAGKSLTAEIARIEREILTIAGGYTKASVQGAWLDAGKVYTDRSLQYTITTPAAQDAAIASMLPRWCSELRQEALYSRSVAITPAITLPSQLVA